MRPGPRLLYWRSSRTRSRRLVPRSSRPAHAPLAVRRASSTRTITGVRHLVAAVAGAGIARNVRRRSPRLCPKLIEHDGSSPIRTRSGEPNRFHHETASRDVGDRSEPAITVASGIEAVCPQRHRICGLPPRISSDCQRMRRWPARLRLICCARSRKRPPATPPRAQRYSIGHTVTDTAIRSAGRPAVGGADAERITTALRRHAWLVLRRRRTHRRLTPTVESSSTRAAAYRWACEVSDVRGGRPPPPAPASDALTKRCCALLAERGYRVAVAGP